MMAPAIGAERDCSSFINLVLHDDFLTILYTTTEGRFPVEFSARLYVFFFLISVFVLY